MNKTLTPVERWTALRDAHTLASQARAYIEGEQWAVSAVLFLGRETVAALKAIPPGTSMPLSTIKREG